MRRGLCFHASELQVFGLASLALDSLVENHLELLSWAGGGSEAGASSSP